MNEIEPWSKPKKVKFFSWGDITTGFWQLQKLSDIFIIELQVDFNFTKFGTLVVAMTYML
jgi:hypothetical protein